MNEIYGIKPDQQNPTEEQIGAAFTALLKGEDVVLTFHTGGGRLAIMVNKMVFWKIAGGGLTIFGTQEGRNVKIEKYNSPYGGGRWTYY